MYYVIDAKANYLFLCQGVAMLFYYYFGITVHPDIIVGVKIIAYCTTHKTDKEPSHTPRT